MSAKVKTFESLRNIRPHALREGITARAVEGERMTMAVVDLAPSIAYEAGHIPGAWFAVRARLPDSLDKVPRRPILVLTSPDAALARLAAAADVERAGGGRRVGVVPPGGDADLAYGVRVGRWRVVRHGRRRGLPGARLRPRRGSPGGHLDGSLR